MAAPKRKPAARKKAPVKKKVTAKVATKKTKAKKVAPKKTAVKKIVKAKKKPATLKFSAPATKTEFVKTLVDITGQQKKDITELFDAMKLIIAAHIAKRGPGQFTFPGLFKIVVTKKPATKARKGINPFTGEPTIFKAKPARWAVKIRPLKAMKEMAEK